MAHSAKMAKPSESLAVAAERAPVPLSYESGENSPPVGGRSQSGSDGLLWCLSTFSLSHLLLSTLGYSCLPAGNWSILFKHLLQVQLFISPPTSSVFT